MNRHRGSLFGRLMLILGAGLAAAHLLTLAFVLGERTQVMRGMMVSYLATDVAGAVALLERLPAAERAAWLPNLERRNYRFALSSLDTPLEAPSSSPLAPALLQAAQAAVGADRPVRAVERPDGALALRLALRDGTPLAVEIASPSLRLSGWLVALLAAQLLVLLALCWWAVRQATAPLRQLASAADAMRPGQPAPVLPEAGPREVLAAADAFRAMQARIAGHVEERMRILAAVSHDLQTPITRMRLRAESLDDAALRDKLHADLAQMQTLVQEGLAYARSAEAAREPLQAVDLVSLLESMVADYQDARQAVTFEARSITPDLVCSTRPAALRRIVGNLVDNALKFSGAAELSLALASDGAVIEVADRGPGIPEDELQAVLQPYYRVEASRSRATGGTGLGLAIAHQLAQACGAMLVLRNRAGGGLAVTLRLPR